MATYSRQLLSIIYAGAYLSTIYIIPHSRVDSKNTYAQGRNDPAVIVSRLFGVSVTTTLSLLSMFYFYREDNLFAILGLAIPFNVLDLSRLLVFPLGLTLSLFTGSLYVAWLREALPGMRWGKWRFMKQDLFDLQGLRNYILGPITEELAFRSCIIAIYKLSGASAKEIVFISPLYFGLAHVHHAWETFEAGGKTKKAFIAGLLQSTFQFAYTTLFGWYAAFLFIRTGSVIPPILSHMFCNMMGLPPISWAISVYPNRKIAITVLYFVGIGLFIFGFWRWTNPLFFGKTPYWDL